MKVQIVHLEDTAKVSFYTAQIVNHKLENLGHDEYYKFQTKFQDDKDKRQLKEIEKKIKLIGQRYGANEEQFGSEGAFERLPSSTYKFFDSDSDGITDYGLRLYCIRVNDKAVVLLNGGRKTQQNPRKCPNCKIPFEFADKLSKAFYDAKVSGDIEIEGMK